MNALQSSSMPFWLIKVCQCNPLILQFVYIDRYCTMTFYQYSVNKSVVSFLFSFISHKLLHGWPLISCMNVYKSIISIMFDFFSCKLYAWVAVDPLYELLIFGWCWFWGPALFGTGDLMVGPITCIHLMPSFGFR